MIILISGEGPSDVGSCKTHSDFCEGDEFSPGAMTFLVDQIVQVEWGYSPLDSKSIRCIGKTHLVTVGKQIRPGERSAERGAITFPGLKRGKETAYFFKNAYALARVAQEVENREQCLTMAVLFRDCDGTNSTGNGLWEDKQRSMSLGFERASYSRGVPMLPKPKSEAWLLCALKNSPYQNCEVLEDLPGNDRAPNPAKEQLASALALRRKTQHDLPELVADGTIDYTRLHEMPSYMAFMSRLISVARAMAGRPDQSQ